MLLKLQQFLITDLFNNRISAQVYFSKSDLPRLVIYYTRVWNGGSIEIESYRVFHREILESTPSDLHPYRISSLDRTKIPFPSQTHLSSYSLSISPANFRSFPYSRVPTRPVNGTALGIRLPTVRCGRIHSRPHQSALLTPFGEQNATPNATVSIQWIENGIDRIKNADKIKPEDTWDEKLFVFDPIISLDDIFSRIEWRLEMIPSRMRDERSWRLLIHIIRGAFCDTNFNLQKRYISVIYICIFEQNSDFPILISVFLCDNLYKAFLIYRLSSGLFVSRINLSNFFFRSR